VPVTDDNSNNDDYERGLDDVAAFEAPMLSKLASALKNVAVIVSSFIVLALLFVVGVQVIWPKPLIESVSLPSYVQNWGYTSDAFVQKISDGTHEIAQNAKRDFDEAYPRRGIDIEPIEAKIPGSDFTTRSAAQFISESSGLPSRRITGVVTKAGNMFEVSLRIVGGEHLVTKVTSVNDGVDAEALVKAASELAMQLTYPYVFAASSYNDEKATRPTDFVRTIGILDYMLNTGKDLYYAHNLKCNVFVQLYKIDLAKKECEEAIKIDPANWSAQANLGYLYYALAQKGFNPVAGGTTAEAKENCQKALEQLTKAERSHPLRFLYDGWARCLDVLGNPDEANKIRLRLNS
jgi:tetratricopeptide (TPR) repeat protein